MKKRPLIRSCLVLAVLWLMGLSQNLYGQTAVEQSTDGIDAEWHFRFDLFQMLLEERGLVVQPKLEMVLSDASHSVVVVAGQLDRMPAGMWPNLRRFVREGGSLLIASEQSSHVTFIPGIGTFLQTPVTTLNPGDQYQGYADCLRIRSLDRGHPMMQGVSELVTNRSCWFAPPSNDPTHWQVVASLPIDCLPTASRRKALIAVGKMLEVGAGPLVVSSDASLFTNNMLWHGDNAILAIRTSETLCVGARDKLVFVADGKALPSYRQGLQEEPEINETGSVPPIPKPEPELDKLLRLANAAIKNVADSNVLNEALRQQPRNIRAERYLRFILMLFGVAGVLFIFWLLLQSGALQSIFKRARSMQTAFELKSSFRADANDYRLPAGFLAREFCWELTGSRRSADWQRYLVDLQESSVRTPFRKADRKKLAAIIDLASRGGHATITNFDFLQLGKTIATLRSQYNVKAAPR